MIICYLIVTTRHKTKSINLMFIYIQQFTFTALGDESLFTQTSIYPFLNISHTGCYQVLRIHLTENIAHFESELNPFTPIVNYGDMYCSSNF